MSDALKTICPECEIVRWHDREPEDGSATCRGCDYTSTSDERHAARTESRLDDLSPELKNGGETDAGQVSLTEWGESS